MGKKYEWEGRRGKAGREERNCVGVTRSPSDDEGRCGKSTLWSDLRYYQKPTCFGGRGDLCATKTVFVPPNLMLLEGTASRE